ncbi:OmpA family protein [Massilia glaciei]|uniref:OmpA family protein n=1 Tax=Massilia glaciei TaxID=1524097 RepID=A0A2U2HEJ9_9BURK|nr:OmpA family protein [Massilia glaciei]PWF41922.1 OmpA family protein [Massilia glaciei]
MKNPFLKSAIFSAVILLAACSSTPPTTTLLDQARSDFVMANNNTRVSTYAPLEFKQASDALEAANAASARRDSLEQIDKLAYLAKQKIAIAQEVASRKAAEAEIAGAGAQRDQIRLEARTAEAERARLAAANAQAQTADAQRQTAAAEAMAREAQARTAALEAQMADLQAKKTERGMIVTIGDVLFATGKSTLTQGGMNNVRKLADVLNQNTDRSVLVEGFTDSVGSDAANLDLSERRAAAVRDALLSMSVARERIAMRGYGEAHPVAGNDNDGGRQLNRRVEIVLSNPGQPIPPR